MNPAHSSPHGMKAKLLAVALGLCLASTAHSPRVEASGIPVFDGANQIFNTLVDELRQQALRMARECFDVKNLQDAMKRVQAIQRISLRTSVGGQTIKLSEAMPELQPMQGVEEICPDPSGGSFAGLAASSLRDAIGLAGQNLDGSTNLREEQYKVCRTLVYLRNSKWNAERQVFVELENQTDQLVGMMGRWNSMVGSGGGSVAGSLTTGCSLDSGNGPGEGWQATAHAELQANMEQSERLFKQRQAEVEVYQSVISSLEQRQAQIGQMMLNGQSAGFLSGAAAGAIQATLLKTALETAKSD